MPPTWSQVPTFPIENSVRPIRKAIVHILFPFQIGNQGVLVDQSELSPVVSGTIDVSVSYLLLFRLF